MAKSKTAKRTKPAKLGKPYNPASDVQNASETLASVEIGHGVIDGATFKNLPVTYAVIDGRAIFEGDIVLDGRVRPAGVARAPEPEHQINLVQS